MIDDSDSSFFTILGLLFNGCGTRQCLRSHDPILIAAGVGLMLWAAMLGWTVWFIILRR